MVLGYYDASEEDRPDENIWHHPERLDEWFAAVKQRRESGMQPVDAGEDVEMTSNQYLKEVMGGSDGESRDL